MHVHAQKLLDARIISVPCRYSPLLSVVSTFILQGFEDPFIQKESARDESFKFFKFISPAISTWARRVLHGLQVLFLIALRKIFFMEVK